MELLLDHLGVSTTSKQQQQLLSFIRTQVRRLVCLALLVFLLVVAAILSQLPWEQLNHDTLQRRGVVRFTVPNQEWERAEAVKVSLPKTQLFSGWTTDTLKQELPVWVISLARATKRRRTILKELRKAGVTNYQLFDAVDGRNASSVSQRELNKYANAFKRRMWAKQQEHYRAKIAIDLSHYRLLERIVSSNRSAIILEDDARLTGRRWLRDMLRALQELPEDWDVLYLNAVFTKRGKQVGPHLAVVRETLGTIGYLASPTFARKALQAAANPLQNTWIDLMFASITSHHEADAYLTVPPLVRYSKVPSTVDYGAAAISSNITEWERFFMRHAVG